MGPLHLFGIVPKMIQRSVSFQLFWRGVVRNIDCCDVIQIFAPFFRPIVFQLARMKYFIVLEAVKNCRIDSLFVDLSHKLILWQRIDAFATAEHYAWLLAFLGMSCGHLQ